nr:alpha-hydroxy-acid oxidizing protein [uncultured Duganella sp.]
MPKHPLNLEDYRQLARLRLPRLVFDYVDGGAEDELTLRRNRAAFEAIRLRPRCLVDVSRRRQATSLFGVAMDMPLLVAPTGLNGMLWPGGDLALARAAARANVPFVVSTAASATIEEVAEAGGNLWFQLYIVSRAMADSLVERALRAGYKTLVLTVDVPVSGKRERDARNGFVQPFRITPSTALDVLGHPRWAWQIARHGAPQLKNMASAEASDIDTQSALLARQMDASFSWDDLRRLRDRWPHRLLVKGVLNAEDAARIAACGVDGIIISNHGGRQLDGASAPIEVLPAMTRAVQLPILLDSGVRRGADVVKALALGASAVLIGRATLYGLGARGEDGAYEVLQLFKSEIDRVQALIGCPDVAGLDATFIDTSQ